MSESDFVNITRNGELCNSNGEIGMREFEAIMRREVMSYLQTRLTDFSDFRTGEDIEFTHLGAVKTILSELLVLAEEQRVARKDMKDVLGQINSGLPGVAGQTSGMAMPDRADAGKALRAGMEALAAELVGVREAVQQHIAVLMRVSSHQLPPQAGLPPPVPRSARATSCSPTVGSPSSKSRSRQHVHYEVSLGNCNVEEEIRASSSLSAGMPLPVPASDGGLSGSTPSASSDAPEGPVRPAAGRLAGRRSRRASSPLLNGPFGTASGTTAAGVPSDQDGTQGKPGKAPGGKRRVSAATAAAATKAKSPRSDKATKRPGQAAGSVALAGPAMFKMLAVAAEQSGPCIPLASPVALAESGEARTSCHAPAESSPAAYRHPRISHSTGQSPAASGAVQLVGPTASHVPPLAASVRRQLEGEVVLVPSNHRFRQQWRRTSLQLDPP